MEWKRRTKKRNKEGKKKKPNNQVLLSIYTRKDLTIETNEKLIKRLRKSPA